MTITILDKYKDECLSFAKWIKDKNNISEEMINSDFKCEIENLKKEIATNKKQKNFFEAIIINKLINEKIKKLEKECKKTLKNLNQANKKIEFFRKSRAVYKSVKYLTDYFEKNGDIYNDLIKILKKYEKIFEYEYLRKMKLDDLEKIDFEERSKKLIDDVVKLFKTHKLNYKDYFISSQSFLSKLFSFGSLKIKPESVRESHSGKVEDEILQNWMGTINENLSLKNIVIPSSHDSGTYSMKPTSKIDVIGNMATTQSKNIMGQLKSGIRCFDWRMRQVNKVLVFCHGIVNGGNVAEAVYHVLKFIKKSNEIVILTMTHCSKDDINMFENLNIVKNELKKKIFTPNDAKSIKKIAEVTVKDIREKGKNVLILANDEQKDFCFGNAYTSVFSRQTRQSSNNAVLINKEIALLKEKKENKLSKITPIYTPSEKTIFQKGKYLNVIKNFNKDSKDYSDKLFKDKDFVEKANMVSFDDVAGKNGKEFTKKLIELNTKR